MTAIRKSYMIAPETEFGSGIPKDGNWYPVPQGFYLSYSANTQAQSLYASGAKKRQNSIYGSFQGSWSSSFVMDYGHLEFISMIFDVKDNAPTDAATAYDANSKVTAFTETDVYEHRFRKINSRRQTSYVIMERVLNIIAGGLYDETTIIKGVLARNFQLARSTSGSQMAGEMSGVFADKRTELSPTPLESLFVPIDDPLTQYSCMYMSKDGSIDDDTAVEQVDSHSINIETAVSLVYSTCRPIATDYFEDKTTFSWNATAYMNNPTRKFKLLANSGGTLDPKIGAVDQSGNAISITENGVTHALQPMGKNLAPLEYVDFITYAESYRDQYRDAYTSIEDAYDHSDRLIRVKAVNSTIKVSTTPKGDGSKLQDSLSSVECDEIEIVIRNGKSKIWDDSDVCSGPGVPEADEWLFIEPAVSQVSDAVGFGIPKVGYAGQILGFASIPQSEDAMTTVKFDGSDDHPDLKGYVVVTDTAMFNVNGSGVAQTDCRLDNLIPKQLTDGGTAGPSGLTVSTASVTLSESTTCCPQISGTPSVKRVDYYFIVKDNGEDEPASTGYICVAVR